MAEAPGDVNDAAAKAAGDGGCVVAYLVNQYPKVSHTFIRREILSLEKQGIAVERYALRGWDAEIADAEDRSEQSRTRYLLAAGLPALAAAVAVAFARAPVAFLRAAGLALRMAKRSHRPWPYHLVYLAEGARLAAWLRRSRASHLHAHFGTNSAEVAMLAHALGGPPYSFTVHGPEEFDAPEALGLAEKIRRSQFVIAISSYGRSQLYRWTDHDAWPKIHVVHCGVDSAFHAAAPVVTPSPSRLVCVGRICEQKGQLLLLEAMARIVGKGVRMQLVFAGDGEMRPAVEKRVESLGLGDDVRITGWIDSSRVRDEILAARALVLPSFAEGLPVVIMEAMALRRPVISTFVAGIAELVRSGADGWLVPAGDVDALQEALENCLAAPDDVIVRMGEGGRERVLSRHSVDVEAAKLARLFAAAHSREPVGAQR
jgi:colanic acid/amylovoran biosynthesis glycosyltransferase